MRLPAGPGVSSGDKGSDKLHAWLLVRVRDGYHEGVARSILRAKDKYMASRLRRIGFAAIPVLLELCHAVATNRGKSFTGPCTVVWLVGRFLHLFLNLHGLPT